MLLLDLLLLVDLLVDLLRDLLGNLRVLGDVLEDLQVLDLASKTLPLLALLFCRACRIALSPSSQMNCWWTCARIWLRTTACWRLVCPQGGNIVIDNVDELAHWCKPFKRLRKACHAHARDVLAGQSILNIGSWAKLDAGSAAASFENSAYHHCGVAYGSVAPHTDKGDATDVRVCFSFCATVNAGFSPPAWHAGATVEECIAGVVGHISNGSVTLQVGGGWAQHTGVCDK